MLDITFGLTDKQPYAREVARALQRLDIVGSLYIGYPIFATADDQITADALLVTRQHGLVVFQLYSIAPQSPDDSEWGPIRNDLDRLFVAVESSLQRHEELRRGRGLVVEPRTVGIFPTLPVRPEADDNIFVDIAHLGDAVAGLSAIDEESYRRLEAALQRVTTIKPRKRRQKAVTPRSRGSVLKEIEREIANLDQLQKQAAIQTPDGPQRIRGLAGSGKTIVLALKAAYLHAQHPEWNIAVTFQTRSLYQQFQDLIRRFSFEQINDEPDWQKLQVLHAWGAGGREGVYSQIAHHVGADAKDFLYGRARFGRENAFEGVCAELLALLPADLTTPIYDAVLIDEAQDLPPAFFQLVYRFTKDPKRIAWAYDDLQRLSEVSMPTLGELFGTDDDGEPLVSLTNSEITQQDVVLRMCYRNPPWMIVAAHALGLGVYRPQGLVQHFDDAGLWTDVGYSVKQGALEPGQRVTLVRGPDSFPQYFPRLLDPDDVVSHHRFASESEQADWIAAEVEANLLGDELEPDDILIVLPESRTARADARPISAALARLRITSHLAGVTSSVDELFSPESVAIAHIHRSKGNEAAMVYVANANRCVSSYSQVTLRNTLFTAITRSRAWVRVCGVGDQMKALEDEIGKVKENYELRFKIPTRDELAKMRQIHRELSASERQRLESMTKSLRGLIESIARGEIDLEQLPLDVRAGLTRLIRDTESDGELGK